MEVFRGDTTTLKCSGRGYPQANVTWLRNGVALTNNSKYSIIGNLSTSFVGNELTFDSSITINSLVKVDEGNYTCQAQIGNLNLTAEIDFRVTVIIPGKLSIHHEFESHYLFCSGSNYHSAPSF